jgi:hypothetical protein
MKKFKGCLVFIIINIAFIIGIFYYFFFSMHHLPEGEFIKQTISPNSTYTIKFYRINGGATTAYAVRGELSNNFNHKKWNIYWDYKIDDANVVWLDDSTVIINGHRINVKKDTYDWRK